MALLDQIATARITIREYTMDDHASVQRWATDAEVCRFMPWGPNSDAETTAYLERCIGYQAEAARRFHELAIVETVSNQVIGGVGLRIDADATRQQAEVGYVLRRDRWGCGLVAEAVQAMCRLGFTHFDLERIWAATDPQNLGSAKVLEKCGFRLEGCIRQNVVMKGVRRDSLWFGLLRPEWRAANPA